MAINHAIKLMPMSGDGLGSSVSKEELERRIGIELPNALVQLVESIGLPCFFNGDIAVDSLEKGPLSSSGNEILILTMFGFNTGRDGIIEKYNSYSDRIGVDLLPFADDGLGNLFLINLESGSVYFWHHECSEGEASSKALTLVANDFEDFTSRLKVGSGDEPALKKNDVKSFSFRF